MKRILVLGGFGFLGSHLLDELLSDPNQHVHVIDDLSSSPLPVEQLLWELEAGDRLTYQITRVEDFCSDHRALEAFAPCDEIYHLASLVGPSGILPHAGRIATSILNSLVQVADLAKKWQAALLFVSTSEVYGGGEKGYCTEEMPKLVPAQSSVRLEYALGKLAGETALVNLCHTQGVNAHIVRPFNISGPRQSGQGGFVLPRFVGQAILGQDLTVFGNGEQVRAFSHARDIARGLVKVSRRGKKGEIYNLGSPQNRCSILELAEEVRRATGTSSGIRFVDPREIYGPFYAEAHDKYPDIEKARRELAWEPTVSREETIRQTFEYMSALPEPTFTRLRGF